VIGDDDTQPFEPDPEPTAVAPSPPPAVPDAPPDFPVALRGYDRAAVDHYVDDLRRRLRQITPPASPDEAIRRALEEVGEQTARILQEAHDAAARIRTGAEEEADRRLTAADARAAEMLERAERRLRELDAETEVLWRDHTRLLEEARSQGHQLVELADRALERFPPEEPEPEPAPTEPPGED
jgi:cell division septum initiation protein DivIVA